jgi:hypothetical protein
MRKLCLLLLTGFVCGVSMAGKVENVKRYYDDSSIECTVALPKGMSSMTLPWQLTTPHGRVMAQGQAFRNADKSFVVVPLKFEKLKPGINLKLSLQIKLVRKGEVVGEQKMIVYSQKIFTDIAGKLKKLGAGAVLPEDEIAKLNALGLELPEVPLSNFEDPANKVIFCSARQYLDNVDMLSALMKRGITLVMFAPDDESEIFLPLKDFSKISLISSKNAKTKASLGVICNKEKIAVACTSGQGGLVKLEYGKGKIIIVANSVYKALGKIPDAALMLKKSLTK